MIRRWLLCAQWTKIFAYIVAGNKKSSLTCRSMDACLVTAAANVCILLIVFTHNRILLMLFFASAKKRPPNTKYSERFNNQRILLVCGHFKYGHFDDKKIEKQVGSGCVCQQRDVEKCNAPVFLKNYLLLYSFVISVTDFWKHEHLLSESVFCVREVAWKQNLKSQTL